MSLWLSDDELTELTGAKHADKRLRALVAMGVKFRRRPDGYLLVERHQFEGGKQRKHEPNLAVMERKHG